MNLFRNKKSFFEFYEVIILVGAGKSKKSPKGFMRNLIMPRPKSSPYNIERIIPYYIYVSQCTTRYLNRNKQTPLAPQLYVI